MKNKLKYGTMSNIAFLLKKMAKAYPLLIFFMVLQCILGVAIPIFAVYLPKITLDLVINQASQRQIFIVLSTFGGAMAISMALASMAEQGKYMMYNNMRVKYMEEILMKSFTCDYRQMEDSQGQTAMQKSFDAVKRGDWSACSIMAVAMVDIFIALACFVIYSTIISKLNWLVVAILVGFSLVNFIFLKKARKYEYSQKGEKAEIEKRIHYNEWTAQDVKYGKDIRLYGMKGWIMERQNAMLELYGRVLGKIKQRYFYAGIVNGLTLFLRDGGAYGYLIWAVSSGNIAIGDFVLYFGAITGFSTFVTAIIDNINKLSGGNQEMNDLRAFLDLPDDYAGESRAALPMGQLSVEFKNVWFSYEDNGEYVLKDFNLKIEKGEKIALVGVNGAGKTTITKLMMGFYKPTKGQILINGIDISGFKKTDLFELFSTVSQDVFITPFTVVENVSMASRDKSDLSLVEQCLERAGILSDIEKYPGGIMSYMGKDVEDGIVLSGGKQQKLLMARALYKNAPILVLDEPTAALDPIAESETYQSFMEVSGNKTAVYISHRLASTRFCDRIVLLSGGIAKEVGSHEQLIELNGEYGKMFEIQSHYYKKGGDRGENA